ncbi:hypothetical protein BH11MYX1_BH11MYX1_44190 [soil metagenome]
MSLRCLLLVPVIPFWGGCQAKADQPGPASPALIELHDLQAGDKVVASVRPGRPCRATIGPTEMIVGGPPLISQVGATRWSGRDGSNGTTLERDGDRVARIFPIDGTTVGVFDLQGVPVIHVQPSAAGATVSDASMRALRTLTLDHTPAGGTTIVSDHPPFRVSGTSDLVLASVLSAVELQPEVRMLAACERVLVTEKKEL